MIKSLAIPLLRSNLKAKVEKVEEEEKVNRVFRDEKLKIMKIIIKIEFLYTRFIQRRDSRRRERKHKLVCLFSTCSASRITGIQRIIFNYMIEIA